MQSVDGLKCPECKGDVVEPLDGHYECQRCEIQAQIPFTQDGSVYYNKPASRFKAMTFPAMSLLGLFVMALGWAPLVPTILVTVFAYIFLDSLVWAAGGGASKLAAMGTRLVVVAIVAGAVYFQLGG